MAHETSPIAATDSPDSIRISVWDGLPARVNRRSKREIMSNTRIAAAATALVLGATGLAACNDSEDTTDDVNSTGVVSDATDAVTSDDPLTGGSESTGGAITSEDPLSGSATTEDPLAPTDDAVLSEAPLSNEMLSEAPTN